MKFNVSAASRLYGKSRKTLYRHMASGRLAYSVEADSGRTLEMSELIRCYGEPPIPDTPDTGLTHPKMSHLDTPTDTPYKNTALIDELRRQTAVIEKMSERIERLETAMLALPSPPSTQAPDSSSSPEQDTLGDMCESETPRKSVSSFGDLLARMEARTSPH